MNLRRAVTMVAVCACCAAVTTGAGMLVGRGPVAETRVKSVGTGERFEWVDVYVKADAGDSIGAWQIEVKGVGGSVAFVGVEGSERQGSEPPLYDPAALAGGERLVIGAAVHMAKGQIAELPTEGRVRVARVHVRATGALEYSGALVALSDVDGKRVGGTIELVRGEAAPVGEAAPIKAAPVGDAVPPGKEAGQL